LVVVGGGGKFSGCNYWGAGVVTSVPASARLSCFQYNPISAWGATTAVFNTPLYWALAEGPQSAGQGGTSWTITQHTTYIQRVTIWECSGYKTGPCITNPLLTAAP
jgi:hypothetical protein